MTVHYPLQAVTIASLITHITSEWNSLPVELPKFDLCLLKLSLSRAKYVGG